MKDIFNYKFYNNEDLNINFFTKLIVNYLL